MRGLLAVAASLMVMVGGAGAAAADPALSPAVPADGQEVIVDRDPDAISTRSANGCTLSNAGILGSSCVYVNGESDRVNYIQAYIEIGTSFPPTVQPNICNKSYEFQYYRRGFTVPQTVVLSEGGCSVAIPGRQFRMTHHVNARLADGSTVCTRTKSNLSYNEWSPYACVYINA